MTFFFSDPTENSWPKYEYAHTYTHVHFPKENHGFSKILKSKLWRRSKYFLFNFLGIYFPQRSHGFYYHIEHTHLISFDLLLSHLAIVEWWGVISYTLFTSLSNFILCHFPPIQSRFRALFFWKCNPVFFWMNLFWLFWKDIHGLVAYPRSIWGSPYHLLKEPSISLGDRVEICSDASWLISHFPSFPSS